MNDHGLEIPITAAIPSHAVDMLRSLPPDAIADVFSEGISICFHDVDIAICEASGIYLCEVPAKRLGEALSTLNRAHMVYDIVRRAIIVRGIDGDEMLVESCDEGDDDDAFAVTQSRLNEWMTAVYLMGRRDERRGSPIPSMAGVVAAIRENALPPDNIASESDA